MRAQARAHLDPQTQLILPGRPLPRYPCPFPFGSSRSSPVEPEPLSGTWDEEQGGRHGEDDPAGGLVHLEAAGFPRLGRLLPLPLPPSSALNSEQV